MLRQAMTGQPDKMSGILLEMSQRLLCAGGSIPSSEAAHVTLFFATAAWNESVGLADAREGRISTCVGDHRSGQPDALERAQVE